MPRSPARGLLARPGDHAAGDVDAENGTEGHRRVEQLEGEQPCPRADVEDAIARTRLSELHEASRRFRRQTVAEDVELLGDVVVARRVEALPPLHVFRHHWPRGRPLVATRS
jgi:hypothetical protein